VPSTDAFGVALSDLVRCTVCGHRQLARMPSDAMLEEPTARRRARTTSRRRRASERPLAARWPASSGGHPGAATCSTSAAGSASSWPRRARQVGVQQPRPAHVETQALAPAGAFDAAVLGDVIEHLPRPGEALDRLATLLRPGGPRLAWLSLPDAGSRLARAMGARWWSVLPTHVQYFTRGSLATLLRSHGWQVLEVATAPKAFTVRYYLERTGGYSPAAARALVRAARAAGVADRMWAPDFRDRMQVIARAPARPLLPGRPAAA
jgi:SAM-dependent methyltransferase